jgi:hypothetical protein
LGTFQLLCGQSPEPQKSPLKLNRAEIKVPMAEAGDAGLQTVLILPSTPGKHPLVLMTHGSDYSKGKNQQMGHGLMQPQAVWFARRGWVVAIVTRRGYGASGGKMDKTHYGCDESAFAAIADENADDLMAAYNTVKKFAPSRWNKRDRDWQLGRWICIPSFWRARTSSAEGGHQLFGRLAFHVLFLKLCQERAGTGVS